MEALSKSPTASLQVIARRMPRSFALPSLTAFCGSSAGPSWGAPSGCWTGLDCVGLASCPSGTQAGPGRQKGAAMTEELRKDLQPAAEGGRRSVIPDRFDSSDAGGKLTHPLHGGPRGPLPPGGDGEGARPLSFTKRPSSSPRAVAGAARRKPARPWMAHRDPAALRSARTENVSARFSGEMRTSPVGAGHPMPCQASRGRSKLPDRAPTPRAASDQLRARTCSNRRCSAALAQSCSRQST